MASLPTDAKVTVDGVKISDVESEDRQASLSKEDSDSKSWIAYEPIDGYEGKHRWDPSVQWTEEEERAVVKKTDRKVLLFACLMFFALQLDRGNIGSALSDGMLKDIGITTNDFNNGQAIFLCCFLFMELPSQMISKRVGADRWIPIQIMAWSVISIAQCRIHNKATFFITRALLGLCEGGMIPDAVLWMSYFYKGDELGTRLSWFWASLTATNILQAFFAYGILHMRGHRGWTGWQYLFVIEGAVTLAIGVVAWFYLPPSPTEGNTLFASFTEREEVILVNRILRDDPTKGDMHNRQALSWADFKACLTDYDNWPIYLLGVSAYQPFAPPATYLTLTLRSLGFNTFNTNLLVIPSSVFWIANCLGLTWLSRKVKERTFVSLIPQLWGFPLLLAMILLPDGGKEWGRFILVSLLVAYPYSHPILVAWNSENSGSVRLRTVSASLYNICVQIGSIASTQVYRTPDAPYYHTGNKALLGVLCYNVVLFLLVKLYFINRNKQKATKWNALTPEEQEHYARYTTDSGNKRLDFVFKH